MTTYLPTAGFMLMVLLVAAILPLVPMAVYFIIVGMNKRTKRMRKEM